MIKRSIFIYVGNADRQLAKSVALDIIAPKGVSWGILIIGDAHTVEKTVIFMGSIPFMWIRKWSKNLEDN